MEAIFWGDQNSWNIQPQKSFEKKRLVGHCQANIGQGQITIP